MTLGVRQLCVAIAAALTAVAPTSRPAQVPLSRSLAAHGGLTAFQSIADWTIIAARPGDEIYEEHMRRDERSGGLQTLLIKRRSDGIQTFLHDGEAGFALVDGNLRNDPGAAAEAYYQAHGEYYLRALPFKWADPGMISEQRRTRDGAWAPSLPRGATRGPGRRRCRGRRLDSRDRHRHASLDRGAPTSRAAATRTSRRRARAQGDDRDRLPLQRLSPGGPDPAAFPNGVLGWAASGPGTTSSNA